MKNNLESSLKALEWWREQVAKRNFILLRSEFPSDYLKRFLLFKGYAGRIKSGLYILKKPEDDLRELFLLYYFKIVNRILSKYSPWALKGESALDIYLGVQKIPETLHIRTKKNIKYTCRLFDKFRISIINDPKFDSNLLKTEEFLGEEIPIDIPERILLDFKNIENNEKQFLKSQEFDYRLLEIMYQKSPSPVVFRKLCRILSDLGRHNLAKEMKSIMERNTFYQSVRVGEAPNEINEKIIPALNPWVLRQSDQIKYFSEVLEDEYKKEFSKIPRYSLKEVLEDAEEKKEYDIYHSTTIEGYHITPEDVSQVLMHPRQFKNKNNAYPGRSRGEEKLRNAMAILGYKEAFNFVLKQTENNFLKAKFDENLIKDIYFRLFKPSVELNIIDGFDLVRYRNSQNYIRGSRHVPPAPEKVTDLMESLIVSINQVKSDLSKAILAHYAFVTIHPYMDGNGRTARLLMNYILLSGGYKLVTIQSENRNKYFKALECAQADDNIIPFARLIVELLG